MKAFNKMFALIALFLLAFCGDVFAQTCRVYATVFNPDSTTKNGIKFELREVSKDGFLISQRKVTKRTKGAGYVFFNILQGATAKIEADVPGFDVRGGVSVSIPAQDSVALHTLVSSTSVPVGKEIVDVSAYGVHHDSSATHNSSKIAEACAFARARGYGTIYFPAFRDTVHIKNRIILDWAGASMLGAGTRNTILKPSADFDLTWTYGPSIGGGAIVLGDSIHGGKVSDFSIDYEYRIKSGSNGVGNGVQLVNPTDYLVERVNLYRVTGHTYGIWLTEDIKNVTVQYCRLEGDPDNANIGTGLASTTELIQVSGQSATGVNIIKNYIQGSSLNGLFVYNSGSTGDAMYDVNVYGNTFKDCYRGVRMLRQPGTGDLVFGYSTYHDNFFEDNYHGISVEGNNLAPYIRGVKVDGNIFRNNGAAANFSYVYESSFTNNTIYGDTITTDFSSSLILAASTEIAIRGNEFFNVAGTALTAGSGNTYITTQNNTIAGSGKSGVIYNTEDGVIDGNVFWNVNDSSSTSNLHGSYIGLNNHARIYAINNIMHDKGTPIPVRIVSSTGYTDPADSTVIEQNFFRGLFSGANAYHLSGGYTMDSRYGRITLSAGTTTDVTIGHDYGANFHILLTGNTAAEALGIAVSAYISNGFRISHSTAVGTEEVYYEIKPGQ